LDVFRHFPNRVDRICQKLILFLHVLVSVSILEASMAYYIPVANSHGT
jgi:hypothetical protein